MIENNEGKKLAILFGGTGFLGSRVATALVRSGWQIKIVSRRARHDGISSKEVSFIQANVTQAAPLIPLMHGASAVINLTGILMPSRTQGFDAVHHQGAKNIAMAAKTQGINNIIHVSAIGADGASASTYARSKAAGERAVLAEIPCAVIIRPSIIFGPGDSFFNRFATIARFSPMLPLIGGGETLFQPVFVDDVATMITLAVNGRAQTGAIYELGGPEQHSFINLLRYINQITGRKRLLIPIPFSLAKGVAWTLEQAAYFLGDYFPKDFLITRDQVALLRHNNIVSQAAVDMGRTLEALGIIPQKIDAIVPTYLGNKSV